MQIVKGLLVRAVSFHPGPLVLSMKRHLPMQQVSCPQLSRRSKSCAHLLQDDIQEGLRYVFQTDSKYTLLASGTGHAGMESCLSNLVEAGDKVVIGNNGIWGNRAADMAGRYGGARAPAAWLDPCIIARGSYMRIVGAC